MEAAQQDIERTLGRAPRLLFSVLVESEAPMLVSLGATAVEGDCRLVATGETLISPTWLDIAVAVDAVLVQRDERLRTALEGIDVQDGDAGCKEIHPVLREQ